MGDYVIRRLTNQDPEFYPLLGPFLGSRQVANALGNPAWDDPGKVWYVALDAGTVCGFVASLPQAGNVVFCSDYVTPEHREQGLYNTLFVARLQDHQDAPAITATVAPGAVGVYTQHGFTPVGAKGRYTTMRRTLAHGGTAESGR